MCFSVQLLRFYTSKKQQHFRKMLGRKSCWPQLHKLYKYMSPYALLIYYHNTCILKYTLVCTMTFIIHILIIHQYIYFHCVKVRGERRVLAWMSCSYTEEQCNGVASFLKHTSINKYDKIKVNTKISEKLLLNTKYNPSQ